MIPAQRQTLIINKLLGKGILSIAEIAHLLDVSEMTIRRDIKVLEVQGRAISVAGGIQLPERLLTEPSHHAKLTLFHEQKTAIGYEAMKQINPDSIVYLDAGTTTLEIAYLLVNMPNVTVVTNDFVIAAFLSQESNCRLFHTGGEVERINQSGVGALTACSIQNFNFDVAFISTSSFGPKGISTPQENKIPVKQAIIECSSRKILVTDSSKYGRIGTFNVIPLDQLSAIITDENIPESAHSVFTQHGVDLIIANSHNSSLKGNKQ